MLNLLRLIKTFARSGGARNADPLSTFITQWRVLPGDVDVFSHMTNSRYLAMMDLGRVDFLLQCGYLGAVRRQRWVQPVGSSHLEHQASLQPFERYELHTRLVWWDGHWFYFRQDFHRVGDSTRPVCTGHVKTLFRGRDGVVPTAEVIRCLTGGDLPRPALPDALRAAFNLADPRALPALPDPAPRAAERAAREAAEVIHRVSHDTREPLAIVGIGCRLPGGVHDPESYWQLLMAGGDAIVDIPPSRWDARRYHDPSGKSPGRSHVHRAGLLHDDLRNFDAAFFGISPREAEVMDPQQRLLLETSWEAMEDAGIAPPSLAGSRTAVYTGAFMIDNFCLRSTGDHLQAISAQSATTGTMTMLSARLSYFYDLRGPCMTIDTACSSSLVATHHACESLWRGESDLALVAGVNVLLAPGSQVTMSKGQFLSPTGHCHAFGADADGYTRGEGAAVLLLQPLSAAQRAGRRIYAVIRGSACNQDGRTSGITVPNGSAQVAVMREAYAKAGVLPRDVAYVEAHGTGTPVGDPIEARAIGELVGAGRQGDERCVIASVKTNLGHLEAAAGVAGLIKAALCVHHGVVPPHLHAQRPNPAIPLDELGLRLPQQATPLRRRGGQLVAGVNSFGYGGTNAHVVLAEPLVAAGEADTLPVTTRGLQLLPLSARSRDALAALAPRWGDALAERPEQASALLRTAALHRGHHRFRAALVGADAAQLADAARRADFIAQGEADGTLRPVFVFSGMGPQWWAMGRSLLQHEPAFRRAALHADGLFQRMAGWSIVDELLRDEADSRMHRTEVAQPANALLQIALTELWASWGIRPAAVIGHSIGEVGAAYAAGVLDAGQALCVAWHRSRLQQTLAGQGGMLAVGLSADDAQRCVQRHGDGIAVAAVNGRSSVTLAGRDELLDLVAAELEAARVFQRRLQVEVPYHSPVMDPIEPALRQALAGLRPCAPAVPVYSTVTGGLLHAPWHDADYWWRNVRQTVRFADALQAALGDGHRCFVEVGPHPVLASSLRDGLQQAGVDGELVPTLVRGSDDRDAMTRALARLYTLGADVDWAAFAGSGPVVRAPTYPWQRKPCWTEPAALRGELSGDITDHPLITLHQGGPLATWTAELNLGRMPEWLDHVVAGLPLFPAAGFIELALSARARLSGQAAASIEQLDLLNALPLDPSQAIRVRVQNAADAAAFRVSAQVDAAEPVLCVRGNWFGGAASEQVLDLQALADALPQALEAPALYERLARMGLQYGPAFRAVQRLRRSEHQVMAWLQVEDVHVQGYALSPMLLDAALHSMLALGGDAYLGAELVPTGIKSLSFHHNPGAQAVVVGSLDTSGAEPRCDLQLLDADGRVCLSLRGLTFRVLPRPQTVLADLACHRQYEAATLPAMADDGLLHPTVVLGAPAGLRGEWLRVDDHAGLVAVLDRARLPSCLVDLRWLDLAGAADPVATGEQAARRFLATLQAIAPQRISRYVLVTRHAESAAGDEGAPNLAAAFVLGMARTAMSERPDLKMTVVDVDTLPDALHELATRLGDDQEWALRNGAWQVARVQRTVLPAAAESRVAFDRERMDCTLEVARPGRLDSLRFVACERLAPAPGQVEIAVEAVPLGYKDVMKALGLLSSRVLADTYFGDGLGMECTGRIVALGQGVTGLSVGDRVYASASGTLRARLRVDATMVARLPDGVSLEDGANLSVYGTVYHGLVEQARLGRGETVLIHGATGGVGLAAIQVARWLGAQVIATAGSDDKRQWLRAHGVDRVSHSRDTRFHDDVMRWTDGRGVDVVLNFTPGDVMLRSLSCLARFGRFVEIGKVAFDQDSAMPTRAFNECLSFHAVDFDRLTRHKPAQVLDVVHRVLAHMAAGDFQPHPVQRFGASQVDAAFRLMARSEHIGKVVVDMTDADLQVVARPPAPIDPAATYLVTGGLGGFGLEVARDLVARGARHLALLSRRGAASDEAREALAAWQQAGVDVRPHAVDVADAQALAAVLHQVRQSMPPLQGVFHAAAVLDDRPLQDLDDAALHTAYAAKAGGAWHLHRLTQADALRHFVLFSSVSAVIGNVHQANYVGANLFLDQLAQLRRAAGLPALSVQWGVLGDSGMVARQAGLGRVLEQQGIRALGNAQALDALHQLLALGDALPAHLVVADVDWARMARQAAPGSGAGRLAAWRQVDGASGESSPRQQWAAKDEAERRQGIEGELLRISSGILKLQRDDLNPGQPLREMGLDSLMAMEIALEIESTFGLKLPTMAVASGPSLRELTETIASEIVQGEEVAA